MLFFLVMNILSNTKKHFTLSWKQIHTVKPFNFFLLLIQRLYWFISATVRICNNFNDATPLFIYQHQKAKPFLNNYQKYFENSVIAKLTIDFFHCFSSSIAMSTQFWLCFNGCLVSSHHLSKLYYKSLFPTTLRFIMWSVNGGLDTASVMYRVTLPLECFHCSRKL